MRFECDERKKGGDEREYFRYVAVDCKPEQSFATRLDGIVDGNLAGVVPPCRFIGDVSSIISKREPSTLSRRVQLRPKFVLLCSARPRYPGRDRERLKMIDISLKINGPRCTNLYANSRTHIYERIIMRWRLNASIVFKPTREFTRYLKLYQVTFESIFSKLCLVLYINR